MAQTVSLLLSARDRVGLRDVIEDRGRPVKHVQRAQIVLASADHLPVLEIANRSASADPWCGAGSGATPKRALKVCCVTRRARLAFRRCRRPRSTPWSSAPLRAPPGAVTHWTGRAMAKAMGLSLRTVPTHLVRSRAAAASHQTFKRSNRSRLRRQARRRRRTLHEPAAPCPWWSPSTRRARSRRSTARSPACR